jgi:ATP-dependent DNA helicase DinG
VSGLAPATATQDNPAPVLLRRRRIAAAFAGSGELAAAVDGFTPRAAQQEMALAVFDTIVERGTLIAEAGTGTGKTFAYLVPALLAGGKVLISTGTKTLQDQVYAKDLGTLIRALGLPVDAALLKGRQNYLCLQRLARAEAEGRLPSRQDAEHLRAIGRFARLTATGDRAELAEVPESAQIWPLVTSTRENCIGQECPRLDECFVYKARRAAQAADVVVVNHHLFLADLALRDDAVRDFLPAVDTVILDEAHQLPRTAADFFGSGWSLAQLADLAQDARALGLAKAAGGAAWVTLSQAIESAARNLRLLLAEAGLAAGSRIALERCPAKPTLRRGVAGIDDALRKLAEAVKANAGRDVELDALAPRLAALRAEIGAWLAALDRAIVPADEPEADAGGQDGGGQGGGGQGAGGQDGGGQDGVAQDAGEQDQAAQRVRWVALTAHGAQFNATPLAPGAAFARAREQQVQAWILTSATLTLAGSFAPFLADIGLPQARTERWDSPFDFQQQALLYLPKPLPSPLRSDFPEQVADAAWPVIAAAGGRAFVLCSTLRAVERVAARLRSSMQRDRLELPLLVQGASTRRALLDEFRRHGNAVLVGSVSFWEGIDVRGEALSLVVIDKLPFAPPDDPVVEARIRRLKSLGRNPFLEYQLPEAVTLLKQGVGRLIRDERDRGVLMILDERLLGKPYGRTVLASLPPFARTREEAVACGFFGAPDQR